MYNFTNTIPQLKLVESGIQIKEYIEFGDFNSKNESMYLIERDAPTPGEKAITETLPFMQGVYDFSMMMGERFFENRTISYTFILFGREYTSRKVAEIKLKRDIMKNGVSTLIDSHDYGYYWRGKCSGISIDDDEQFKKLSATIEFDCYPFMISRFPAGNDIWDIFCFELDVAQHVKFDISGHKDILLVNTGSRKITPSVTATAEMTIEKDNTVYVFPAGTSKNDGFIIELGENNMGISGEGNISFQMYNEVMG